MEKIRFGILGGTRGMDFVKKVLLNHPYAEVVSICEAFKPLIEKIKSETDINVFSDYDEFLESGLDAVVIANFANEHAPFAIKALNKGIHVYCENQPMQTMKEAVELCEAVEKSGKVYGYAENYCYLPQVLEMRKIYQSGVLGEVMYAEGNFINDCSSRWHLLTRGDRNHWRNLVPSTFYCTHSIGPMMYITGRRAVNVVGMETPLMNYMKEKGARSGSAAMEIMHFDNGAIAKSMNGNYRRDFMADYRIICENGTVETDLYDFGKIRVYDASKEKYIDHEVTQDHVFDNIMPSGMDVKSTAPFALSDYYALNTFILSVLGNEEAKSKLLDVYRALDMSTIGPLAYRSILNGSTPINVPDLRIQEQRDEWRNDNKSTDPKISKGEDLLPSCKSGFVEVDDEVYERVAKEFFDVPVTIGMH